MAFNFDRRPRIGIEVRFLKRSIDSGFIPEMFALNRSYYQSVKLAGGFPVLIPPALEEALVLFEEIDGLLMTGGLDVPSKRYGEAPHKSCDFMPDEQDETTFSLIKKADEKELPVLGICLGAQVMNIHRGGSLFQHIPEAFKDSPIAHSIPKQTAWHEVEIAESLLKQHMGANCPTKIASRHHQSVNRIGNGLEKVAWAPDGVIEAIEDPKKPFFVGIQWHCEDMLEEKSAQNIFRAFVKAASKEHHL